MKKCVLAVMLIGALLLCSCSVTIAVSPVEDFEYEMVDGEIVITEYIGTDLEIRVPKEINDRPVTIIGEEAFEDYDMTRIVLPDSIKYIEQAAFRGCACLEEVELGKGIQSISKYAFDNCENLKKIKFADGLEQIGEYAFSDCTALKEVSLPDSLHSLGKEAFSGCTALLELEIPDETNANIKATPKAMSNIYVSIDWLVLPTVWHQAQTGTMFSELQKGEAPSTMMVVSEGSVALQQLQEAERCYGIDLQELGYYRIK